MRAASSDASVYRDVSIAINVEKAGHVFGHAERGDTERCACCVEQG